MKKDFLMKCVAALAMLLVPLPLMFVFEVTAFKGFMLWHYLIYYAVAAISAITSVAISVVHAVVVVIIHHLLVIVAVVTAVA